MWSAAGTFLLAALAGFLAVKALAPQPGELQPEAERPTRDRPAFRWQAGDIDRWIREGSGESSHTWVSPLAPELAAWTDLELRAALDEALEKIEARQLDQHAAAALAAIFAEVTRRDPEEAVAFFGKVEVEALKYQLAGQLSDAWPPDRAEEGLQFVIENRPFFSRPGGIMYSGIVGKAICVAAQGGPAAVSELLVNLRQHDLDPRYAMPTDFPPGFDFHALAQTPEAAKEGFYIQAWIAQDPGGAFEALVSERRFKEEIPFREIIRAYGPDVGPGDRAEWLARNIGTLREAERQELVEAYRISPEILGRFAGGLPEDDERFALAAAAAEELAARLPHYITFLEAAGPPARRAAMLEATASHFSRRMEPMLRKKLTEWETPADRIEAICDQLK